MRRARRDPEPISERERLKALTELQDRREKANAAWDRLRKQEIEAAEAEREAEEARKARKGLFRKREL